MIVIDLFSKAEYDISMPRLSRRRAETPISLALNSIGDQLFGDSYVNPSKTRILPDCECVLFLIIHPFCYTNQCYVFIMRLVMDSSGANNAIQRIGLSSIFTTFGIKSAEAAEIIELSDTWALSSWGMPNYALAISMIASVGFIYNQYLTSKIARETLKKLKRENRDKL